MSRPFWKVCLTSEMVCHYELGVSAILNQISMFGMYCLTSALFVVKVASGLIMLKICLWRDVRRSAVGLKVVLILPSVKEALTSGMAWL